ncbi:hypothetical protein F5X96DRAFT_665443 [Biscogniauxia mediterranea]|nr:hypothetical protein F5X96DRAFT_665443 [Biscogniauxia mediterranea]
MTRPQIIRADTIDLQDHGAPSAKDHKHPPSANQQPQSVSLAPHQAETIREVQEDRAGEEARSPRVSWVNGELQQHAGDLAAHITNSLNGNKMSQDDAIATAQDGATTINAAADNGDVDVDASGDEDMDDDMMDKISSSPSIEDGGYTLPPAWPARVDSLRNSLSPYDPPTSPLASEARSSSPYVDLPEHPPLHPSSDQQASKAPVGLLHPNHHPEAQAVDELPGPPEHDTQQDCSHDHRDSGVDLKVEDFSVDRPPIVEPELDEDDIISPYEFLIPYVASEDEDDDEDFSLIDDPRFIDSGWGGECLQDSEDIDFEFVYALHTFVATVEGQANATKGDTMVLLDDSNSYWWLVRIVKDSSIGYLPAEHIETPTERLARLNKHRNIDLSATMLGDQAEKAKNPIKTAIRRRKKTVTFTAPTYVDYSDIDYSTDEEDGEGDSQSQQQGEQDQQSSSRQSTSDLYIEEDETAKVQPLKPRSQKQAKSETAKPEQPDEITPVAQDEARRSSDDIFDAKVERTTRNGTVRNTDSFFKDETIETKKITLTPGLLRDDNEPRGSNDSKEVRQRPSFEKDLVADKKDDKKKKEKEKKEKDKKTSSIRSFFSRKDKKKSIDDDDESFGKRSLDASTEITDRDMVEEPHSTEMDSSPESASSPQRHGGKLQKLQSGQKLAIATQSLGMDRTPLAAEVRTNNVANVPPATLRMVESEQLQTPEKVSPTKEEKAKSAISKILPSSEARPPKVTKAKSRVELDDFDSPEEDEVTPAEPSRSPPEPQRQPSEEKLVRPSLPGAFPDSYTSIPTAGPQQGESAHSQAPAEERMLESPAQASPIASSNPPALTADTSSQEDRSSPVSSPSPEPAGADSRATHRNQDSTTTSTSTTTTSTWNDANLRAFFDSGSDIRDLLVVVYDKTDVQPVSPEHPVASSLFREQNAKLAEITTQLDNMLGDWLARKQRLRGTV